MPRCLRTVIIIITGVATHALEQAAKYCCMHVSICRSLVMCSRRQMLPACHGGGDEGGSADNSYSIDDFWTGLTQA